MAGGHGIRPQDIVEDESELVKAVDRAIRSIEVEHEPRRVTQGEVHVGGEQPTERAGTRAVTHIELEGEGKPQRLDYQGTLPLEKGDIIRAYFHSGRALPHQEGYVPREPGEQETAVMIEKLRNGEEVATYRQADYEPS